MECIGQPIIRVMEKNRVREDGRVGGDGGLPFYTGRPGESSLTEWDFSRGLKEMGEGTMWLSGGRKFQAEGIEGTKIVREEYACSRVSREAGWNEGEASGRRRGQKIAEVRPVETARTSVYVMGKMAGCEQRSDMICLKRSPTAAVLDIELQEARVDQEASWELMAITWV